MAVALPQRGVRAAALTHLLCVVRLLWLDARAPPFTALLSSPPRWLVLPHTTHTAALNATLSRLSRLDGAARLHVLVSQQLPRSAAPSAASTAQLLRSAPRFPFEWTHRVHFVENDAEKAGLAHVAQALEDVFGGEGAAEGGAIVIDGGVAADLLEFFAFGASLVEATRALPAAERVALVGSVCPHTSQPYRSLAGDSLVPFSPSRYHRLRPVEVTAAWLATKQIYTAMCEDARSALAHNTTIPLEPAAYLQWRWGGSRLVCPEVPRAYRLLEEDTIANR
ncbi:hypothetical protein AB1Y20_002257 [Prymnesium parvum]|uniref:Uncharacterized protein n=1 Tax=Prymnesium parvum TaxID=97485 RepID=A0AB34J8L5_PRYPA